MKNKRVLFSAFILIIVLLCSSVFGCFGIVNDLAKETCDYYLNEEEIDLVVGQSFVLKLYYKNPSTGKIDEYDNVTYSIRDSALSSENKHVATVDQKCKITAVKEGTTNIVYSVGGVYNLKCKVNVVKKQVKSEEIVHFKDKFLINSEFVFRGELYITYTTGYTEQLQIDSVDSSAVDMSALGRYEITVRYKLDGVAMAINKVIEVVDKLDELQKTTMKYNLDDMEKASDFRSALSCSGEQKALAIPVKFADSDNYISNYNNVKADINTVLFGEPNDESIWYSVKEYYKQESNGKVVIDGKVSNWYGVTNPSSYYYNRDKIVQLANDAVDWYFANNPSDNRKNYDSNGDGYFDCLYVVYASPDYVTGAQNGMKNIDHIMWASVLSQTVTADVEKPSLASIMWSSYDFIYGNKEYAEKRTGKSDYAETAYSGFTKDDKLHTATYIHETGHLLGLIDYYSSDENHFSGSANMQTSSSFSHDPYSYLLLGWAEPYIPIDSMTLEINDFQYSHDLILLTPKWNINDSPFDEYLLLELYTPTGLNKRDAVDAPSIDAKDTENGSLDDMQGVGIRLWHVDARLLKTFDNTLTTDPSVGETTFITDNTIGKFKSEAIAEYDKFAMLYQVRKDTSVTFNTTSYSRKSDLFYEGDSFSMEKYKNQFVNKGKLDCGSELGWSFTVDKITLLPSGGATATITLTRAK